VGWVEAAIVYGVWVLVGLWALGEGIKQEEERLP